MGDIGACGNSPSSAVTMAPPRQALPKPEVTLAEPAQKKDSAVISDAARAQLAAERRQDQTYVAQQSVSQSQASIAT